jgi:hypothetical protein
MIAPELSDGDRRVARAILPLLEHRRDAIGRAIEAIEELQRTDASARLAEGVAMAMSLERGTSEAGVENRDGPLPHSPGVRPTRESAETPAVGPPPLKGD